MALPGDSFATAWRGRLAKADKATRVLRKSFAFSRRSFLCMGLFSRF
jgi:hypothetical protein